MFADAGYDVYLANNRGTQYSRKHVTLDPVADAAQYWDFSWAEMGRYDDTAFINFAVENSSFDKAIYWGVSQGTAQMFYSLAHLEESFHQEKTLRFVASTPCFWTPYMFDMDRYVNSLE